MNDSELNERQLRKLRRRIEDFLRHTTPIMLIKLADICNITVPQKLRDRYRDDIEL